MVPKLLVETLLCGRWPQVTNALSKLSAPLGASNTLSDGLASVATTVFGNVTSGDRLDVPNVVTVVTTNSATEIDEDFILAVQKVRNSGIEVRLRL